MAILAATRARVRTDIPNMAGGLNTWTITKLRTLALRSNGITLFDPFNHWVDSTYRKSGWPTLLRFMIIDGDVISETIGSLKYDGSIYVRGNLWFETVVFLACSQSVSTSMWLCQLHRNAYGEDWFYNIDLKVTIITAIMSICYDVIITMWLKKILLHKWNEKDYI